MKVRIKTKKTLLVTKGLRRPESVLTGGRVNSQGTSFKGPEESTHFLEALSLLYSSLVAHCTLLPGLFQ